MKTYFSYLNAIFGLTVRAFREGERQAVTGALFAPDLVQPYLSKILSTESSVAQIVTPALHCYGIVRGKDGTDYVIGPAARMHADEIERKEIALALHLPMEETPALADYLDGLPVLSVTKFADILSLSNWVCNGEKIQPEKILLGEAREQADEEEMEPADLSDLNYQTEKQMLELVRRGDVYTLKKHLLSTQFRLDFNIANDNVRNLHNILIVAATLASRAAIEGGLPSSTAFDLSDVYIRTAETLKEPKDIYALMARMVIDFTRRVGTALVPEGASQTVASCLRWIRRNLTRPITRVDIADFARVSPGYLSALFSREIGVSVTDYIAAQRVDEAKRLLETTDRPLSEIASYLCFSSQSYFQNVFKKHTGMTPAQYRKARAK